MTLTTRSAFWPRLMVAWYDQYMNARIAMNGFQRCASFQTDSIRPEATAMPGSPSIRPVISAT